MDILVIIHGMTPEREPSDLTVAMADFFQRLVVREPELALRFPEERRIFVQWGHAARLSDHRPDQRLTRAQMSIYDRVAYDAVRCDPDPDNVILPWLGDIGIPGVRGLLTDQVKEAIILRGLADAVYYCSAEGEAHVRREVYGQVLGRLEDFREQSVRLHVFSHSLGVAVAHDFLYGLFTAGSHSDFIKEQADEVERERFSYWQGQAADGQMQLGTFLSAASQMPLFVMRRQKLVDLFAGGESLDPGSIGVRADRVRWMLFWDVDDLLGFPTRPLYDPQDGIREIQVNTGAVHRAHTGYWDNSTVIRETAKLLLRNTG